MALVQIVVWMLACASLSASPYKSKTINLDPTYSAKTNQTCTRNGYSGICVPENYCNVDHIIETGGIIEDSDLRAKSECKEGDWCCALENTVTDVLTTQPPKTPETRHGGDECVATKIDKCPWCVSLYKIKGQNSELFCGGVLIGPKVVLTTATCNLVSKKATVVARVPGSPESKKNYKVMSRSPHPHYNSGTREYDLALLLLEEEVGWNNNRVNNGACLALRTPLKDGCYAFGYNANDEIESTILITKSGSCNTGGQGADAACGTSLDGDPCIVATGLPVICPSDTKDLLVTGIVRSPCDNSSAQLGSLQQSSTWLIKELTQLGLGKNKMKVCEVNNRTGKCVEKSYCKDSEFTFSNVIEGHSTGCGAFEECCEEDKVIIPPPNAPVNEGCAIREDRSCPWCVSLFKRGHCAKLWSDNGTTFVGASRELQQLRSIQPAIAEHLEANSTEWHFIPPHSPNFGGLWEAGVKSTKFHLKRVIGEATLTYEEMSTLLSQVEACLNSRPITVDSSDPNDPTPLTPGHFLIGGPLVTVPDVHTYLDSNVSSLTRWQLIQRMLQSFWKRWSQEYLSNLMNRYKWNSRIPEPNIGDIVLIKEDDLPPSRWLMGKIMDKHPGHDNVTRVVSILVKKSIVKRPVNKLCILPISK